MTIEHFYDNLQIEISLRKALVKEEFCLFYQPKIDLASGKIKGVEALIRWEHPEKGIVHPFEFIPLAEESDLIIPIGEWVLRTACKQNKEWQEAGLPPMIMSVNLSARQFYQPNLVEMIQHILEETGLPAEFLELEITESMLMDVHNALNILKDLKQLGIRLSLDDFGTGYSSLYYLKELPIDIIKIDQSFVRNCTVDTKDTTIVRTIIAMAHQLKLEVIAEGIELKDHLIFLQQNFCNTGQGYLFSKPLPAEEFEQQFFEIGEIIHREGIPLEISRQKWLKEALECSCQELQETVRQQQGMIFKFTKQKGKFIHTLCEGELLYRLGFTSEHVVGKELYDFLPYSDADIKWQYYHRAWEGEETVTYERYDNGIWYFASLRPIRRGGQVIEVIGFCVDITQRKESEERYRKVAEYSPKGIVIHRDGMILYANPTALKVAKEDELVGKSIFMYVHPDYYDISKYIISQLNQGIEMPLTEMRLIRKDGKVINIEVIAVSIPYDGSLAIMVVYSDITERKQTEQALAQSKERYKQLINLLPKPIVVLRQGIIKYMNDAGVRIFGFNHCKEVIGKSFLEFFHPDHRKKAMECIQILEQGNEKQVHFLEYKMIRQDGTIFYLEGTGFSILYDGELAVQGIFHDIAVRQRPEKVLQEKEENYRLIAENIQDLIWVVNATGIVKYASPSHETVLGFSPDRYVGKSNFEMVHPDDTLYVQKQFGNMVLMKTPCSAEFRYKHSNGEWVYLEAVGTPVLDEGGEVEKIIVVARNISERKKAEEWIRKSEKLSVVRQLAAGVAHEIRTPLTSIKGFVQLLQKVVEKPLYTNLILSEIDRLEEIVKRFLSLAYPQPLYKEEVDTKNLLQEVIRLFSSQAILKNVKIVQEPISDLPKIYCDRNQIKQVFINILQNAVEAMPNGGSITIQTYQPLPVSIKFRFIDQGNGIPEERLKMIWEPFFSTKEKGTGLSLMLTQKIVQEHGGTISIESKLNQGTVVEVTLPIQHFFDQG